MLAVIALLAASSVSLNCTLKQKSDDVETNVDITLNESTGTASYVVRETGALFTNTAQFTPDAVFIADGHGGLKAINRSTLKILEGYEDKNGQGVLGRSGQCVIAEKGKF